MNFKTTGNIDKSNGSYITYIDVRDFLVSDFILESQSSVCCSR